MLKLFGLFIVLNRFFFFKVYIFCFLEIHLYRKWSQVNEKKKKNYTIEKLTISITTYNLMYSLSIILGLWRSLIKHKSKETSFKKLFANLIQILFLFICKLFLNHER